MRYFLSAQGHKSMLQAVETYTYGTFLDEASSKQRDFCGYQITTKPFQNQYPAVLQLDMARRQLKLPFSRFLSTLWDGIRIVITSSIDGVISTKHHHAPAAQVLLWSECFKDKSENAKILRYPNMPALSVNGMPAIKEK